MANTKLTQTGAEVQADLDKVEGLANIKTIGSGLSLSNAGELSASGGASYGKLYLHSSSQLIIKIYALDGTDITNWQVDNEGSLYHMDINQPFSINYDADLPRIGPVLRYGSNANSGKLIPMLLGTTLDFLDGTGVKSGAVGLLYYTIINKDMHIAYVDGGVD